MSNVKNMSPLYAARPVGPEIISQLLSSRLQAKLILKMVFFVLQFHISMQYKDDSNLKLFLTYAEA